jgi:hypothetical protein
VVRDPKWSMPAQISTINFVAIFIPLSLVALRTPSGRSTRYMTCASRPRSRAVPRPDAVQLADETARKPQSRAAAAERRRTESKTVSGKPRLRSSSRRAYSYAAATGRRCLFPQIRSQKQIASVPQISDGGLHAFEYLAPHFTALMVGRIDIEVPVPGH